ncbi:MULTISPECIES: tRNA (adenosine(37)-N6)-dimethylallyltransferase MiaA [Anaeromyxobacter]|uniref:tRNA (adenosine(37)-N6)-dimethylallyltransferase MiaA n=1 Tax=Anaeromyxobacter TaxID=161492 RepID=UPI001F570E7E|nr:MULTISPECIES: tRNA (adenosine(37)-N6)-dimethylallyltransferase MiaA [unclassified Anaeromyxobacter]
MRLLVIAGPTASGKTALAVALARRLGGEIVNADSQQVYRGLDVGTAKPSPTERAAAPHHLLDVVEPGEGMDAARFAALADAAIADVAARGRLPIVAGGTGLYVRALLHGVVAAPGRDPALRARLEEEAARLGRPALHARLAAIDPESAARIRPNDLVRIVRALEIAAAGRRPSELHAEHAFQPDRYAARLLALDPPRAALHARIDARVVEMFAGGILDEARALVARTGGALPAKLPIGYAEAVACVRGELELAEAIRRVQVAHRRYARRQVIWLRRERGVEWIAPPVDVEVLARRVENG